MKNKENIIDQTKLVELFRKWNISQPPIARAISMPFNTFKNKLNPNLPIYRFSKAEYLKVLQALTSLSEDIKLLIFSDPAFGDQNLTPSKK